MDSNCSHGPVFVGWLLDSSRGGRQDVSSHVHVALNLKPKELVDSLHDVLHILQQHRVSVKSD